MPLYSYKCPSCSSRQDVLKPLSLLDREEPCQKCTTSMQRQISPVIVRGDYAGYTCPITGTWIEGRKAHRENLAKHGCRVYEPGETSRATAARAAAEAALDASVESTVDEFIATLPSSKREQLAAELDSGLDVAVTRA